MTRHWLPDAELDPHPRWTWFAECCIDLTISAMYRVQAMYPPEHRVPPGTLVVSNHLRDADVPILTAVLCRRRRLRVDWPMPFFVSREDLFWPDFLFKYFRSCPGPFRRLIGMIPLAWFLRTMRVEPIRRVPEYTLDEALNELPTDDGRAHWLNARGQHEIAVARLDNPQNRGKLRERRDWGLRRLHAQARHVLAPMFRQTVDRQLKRLAGLLDTGRVVYMAPEGTASQQGYFGRIRAGVWELTHRTATAPHILPLGLSYDALSAGRLRAVVNVGTPLASYCTTDKRDFDSELEARIRTLYPVNASHLVSRFLVAGHTTFTTDDFAQWLDRARGELASAGCALDPQLAQSECRHLAEKRLRWLRRERLVTRTASGWRNCWPRDARAAWKPAASAVRYTDNALGDHLSAMAPDLMLQP